MALYETTLASAAAIDARQLVLTSGASVAIGDTIRVDGELFQVAKGYVAAATIVPVLRGQGGTVATAHGILARVVGGNAADFNQQTSPQENVLYPIAGLARTYASYGANGAIDLPPAGNIRFALLNGTVALAMTLAAPTKDLDWTQLVIAGAGAAAHAVTITGLTGGSLTALTMDATGKGIISLMAVDEQWVPFPSPLSGTLTTIDVAAT
jgi:hypothetical protein